MTLKFESEKIEDYLGEIPPYIRFDTPLVQQKIDEIKLQAHTPRECAELAFRVARDEIHHSFDTKNPIVTISGESALENKEGICFAKAHLLASLLRGMEIPTGFCYQRVLRDGKTIESGYALHGLNAVYLEGSGWFRLDPRGNKPGIDSQFSMDEEKLAYPIRPELGEIDYPYVYTEPLDSVLKSMEMSETSQALFHNRPEVISMDLSSSE